MSDKTLTSGEISSLLDIPSSTIRRYVARFGDYLSESARKPRGRTFTESDVAVIARIRDLASHGSKLDEIPDQLESVITPELSDNDIKELQLVVVNKKVDNLIDTVLMLEKRLYELERRSKLPLWKRIIGRDE